jgi:branched-chain amino acid transport system substrate-binding protein
MEVSMKRILSISVLAALAVTVTFVGCQPTGDIKIGAILPLTGGAAVYGQWARNGIDLATSEINAAGGIKGRKVVIVCEDDQSTPQQAVSAAQKLIATDGVKVIIGALTSSATLAVAPVCNEKKVVELSPGSSSPLLTGAGPYFFRNWPSDVFEGKSMADFAISTLKLHNVAILYINNDYGTGLKDVFKAAFEKAGGMVPLVESYDENSTDFRSQLSKVKSAKVDGIYVPGHTNELGTILRQMKEMGIALPFMSVVGFESPQTIEIAGKAAEGAYYTAPAFSPADTSSRVRQFVGAYQGKYGQPPEIFAAHAYDAVKILAGVIAEAGYNADRIREALHKVSGYPGVSGLTTFDANGDVEKPAMIKTVKDGVFVAYK